MPEGVGYRNVQGTEFPLDATDEEIAEFLAGERGSAESAPQEAPRDRSGELFGGQGIFGQGSPGGPMIPEDSTTVSLPSPGGVPLSFEARNPEEAQGARQGVANAAGTAAVVGPALANPLAAVKGLALAEGGRVVGSLGGDALGGLLEKAGYPEGTSDTLSTAGGFAGSALGLFRGPQMLRSLMSGNIPFSRMGILQKMLRAGVSPSNAAPVAGEVAAAGAAEAGPLAATAAQLVKSKTFRTAEEAMAFLKSLNPEQAAAVGKQVGVAAPVAGGASAIPRQVGAARPVAPAPGGDISGEVQRARRTLQGSAANDLSAFDASAASTARAAPLRAEIGSEKAARVLRMSRGQVQRDAGTILDEALGETSKIIPAKPWASIIKTMKALPPNERVAYVARAKDIKSRGQIENLRRTLEELGLLLPVGVGAGVVGALPDD